MIRIFRIATLIVAVASPAAAQIADVSLLSPTRLTGESWIPRPAVTVAQGAQEGPAAPAPAAVPATAPAAVPAPENMRQPLAQPALHAARRHQHQVLGERVRQRVGQ